MDNTYREYLISKKWEGYKKAIHYIYNDECFICGREYNLHVHHKTYDRIYHEDLDDLVLLCDDCHSIIHGEKDFEKAFIKRLNQYSNGNNAMGKDINSLPF